MSEKTCETPWSSESKPVRKYFLECSHFKRKSQIILKKHNCQMKFLRQKKQKINNNSKKVFKISKKVLYSNF